MLLSDTRSGVQLLHPVQRCQGLSGRFVLFDGRLQFDGGRQEKSGETGPDIGADHEEHDAQFPTWIRLFRR